MPDSAAGSTRWYDSEARRPSPDSFSAQERDVLERVNLKVAAAESLETILNFLFDATREVFPCDRLSVALLEEDGRRVTAHWSRADYQPLLLNKGYTDDLQNGSLATVMETGRPRVINDLEAYVRDHPRSGVTRLLIREGVRSSMTCPLIVEGRKIGFLFRNSRKPNAYDDRQVLLHVATAERLSQAVEKAWRIEQLTAANRAYFEMLGFVSHELKSPVASIAMDGKVLAEGLLGELNPEQSRKVGRMVQKAEHLLSLVREYLDLARLEGGELRGNFRTNIDFASQIVEPAVVLTESLLAERRMKLNRSLNQVKMVEGDLELLKIVMVNLLGNAAKYGVENGEIRLHAERNEQGVRVSVWNEGPGFPPEQKGRLFRKFSRLQTPELLQRKGTGVGLYSVWRIIQLHGGRIWANSELGKWAEFIFEIPQPSPKTTS